MSEEVRFELPDPLYEEHTWVLQDEHGPSSQPPLIATIGGVGMQPPEPGAMPSAIRLNGYNYRRSDSGLPFGQLQPAESVEELVKWRREWIPDVEALAQRLESFEPAAVPPGAWDETLAEHEREHQRVFSGVHRSAVGPGRAAVERFTTAFVQQFGEERRQDALGFTQGFPNLSLDRAAACWNLSRLLRSDPRLRQALDRSMDLLGESPSAVEFQRGFAALLESFGHTTNNGVQDLPTWAEDPSIPLAIIRGYAAQGDDRGPIAGANRQRERRLELERELRGHIESDPSAAPILTLMEMAQQFLPNLEDHNLLTDQRLHSASRARWLAVGRYLQERGAATSPDDAFYYQRPELIDTLEGGPPVSRDEIARRRAIQVAYRAAQPPPVLGKPLATQTVVEVPQEAMEGRALRGTPASPGSYRGRARVVESLSEASQLVEGDVLVCRSTTPPWSPYFGIVGAVITNSGGMLSHGAIVAREFGIPAVVGLTSATALISDGATVTVDGTTGIVVVASS